MNGKAHSGFFGGNKLQADRMKKRCLKALHKLYNETLDANDAKCYDDASTEIQLVLDGIIASIEEIEDIEVVKERR
jgi:hypothetical protein